MPPAPPPSAALARRPVITGTMTVRRRPNWIVLCGDPEQILNVIPAAVAEGCRASRSYGGLLVRRDLYEAFYRTTGAHRAPATDADRKLPAPDSDPEDAPAGGRKDRDRDAALATLRESVDDLRRIVQDVARQLQQQRSPVAGLGGLVTRGPSSAVVSVSVAPSTLRPPSPSLLADRDRERAGSPSPASDDRGRRAPEPSVAGA